MKKAHILILLALTAPTVSPAATMCSKNDTTTIVLDPSIGGTGYSYSQAQSTWWTWFSYGTVRGISACLSSNNGKSMGGTVADLHDNNALVVGGETNGQYCWCRMTHPALSLWAFYNDSGSAGLCAGICAYYCGNYVRIASALRAGLFGSVAPLKGNNFVEMYQRTKFG